MSHFKWWYEGKDRPSVGFLRKVSQNYIIIPTEPYNYSFTEDSIYIAVRSPPGFINQWNETICYFNATIQLLKRNVLFRQLILKIDLYSMMNSLDKTTTNLDVITKM